MKKSNPLWSFFSSVKLTIVLLVLIVLVFIIATFLPQEATQEFAWLSDLYHSLLFYALMVLLSLNLIICSINRFLISLKQYKDPPFPEPAGIFENLPPSQMIIANKETNKVSATIESSLKAKYRVVRKIDTKKGHVFYGERGRFSIFGVYAVHISILLIIVGAVIGSIFGLAADINIKEGESVNVVNLAEGKGIHQLDFSIRCDKFIVEFYENGAPKTYRSDLSFIKNGHVAYRKSLLVNHPLTFEGLRFYQESYGTSPETKAVVTYTMDSKKSREIVLAAGDTYALPEQNARVTVLRVEENIMELGPAVKLKIISPKKDIQFWVFKNIDDIKAANPGLLSKVPLFNPGLFRPLVFSLNRIEQQYYTGLRVVSDPGVPLVAVGAALMIAGLMIVFFWSHQRFWVRMEQEEAEIRISIAGRSNRNNAVRERQIDNLFKRIGQELQV
ncbi:MAG: cytochrome c biogenesis protein ResB [Smithellaceae bacterium]